MSGPAANTDDLDAAFASAGSQRRRQPKTKGGAVVDPQPADGPAGDLALVVDVAKLGPAWLPNGYYTLTFPCGTHRVLRVYTQQKGTFAGRRLIGLLIGPELGDDVESFGFVNASGVVVWKRHRKTRTAEYAQLLWELMKGEKIEGHAVLVSKRCRACNRPLVDPLSIKLEVGPICRERTGFTGWSQT